jgi:hypothetical protein
MTLADTSKPTPPTWHAALADGVVTWAKREGTLAVVGVALMAFYIFVIAPEKRHEAQQRREDLAVQLETARTLERSVERLTNAVQELKLFAASERR